MGPFSCCTLSNDLNPRTLMFPLQQCRNTVYAPAYNTVYYIDSSNRRTTPHTTTLLHSTGTMSYIAGNRRNSTRTAEEPDHYHCNTVPTAVHLTPSTSSTQTWVQLQRHRKVQYLPRRKCGRHRGRYRKHQDTRMFAEMFSRATKPGFSVKTAFLTPIT